MSWLVARMQSGEFSRGKVHNVVIDRTAGESGPLMAVFYRVLGLALLALGGGPSDDPSLRRYDWPFAPSNEPHAVASCFHNPMRTADSSSYLHGGIDIIKPVGTAILSVADGFLWVYRDRGFENLLLTEADGTTWEYRHVAIGSIPADVARAIDRGVAVSRGTKLGEVGRAWPENYRHLHLNLRSADGRILNPLDRLPPLQDTTAPDIHRVLFLPDGADVPFEETSDGDVVVAGRVDIAVHASDTMQGTEFSSPPLRFRWQVGKDGAGHAFDPFPGRLPQARAVPVPRYPRDKVDAIYLLSGPAASHNPTYEPVGQRWVSVITNELHGEVSGAGAWDTTAVEDGAYDIVVTAWDHSGNERVSSARVRVSNRRPPPIPGRSVTARSVTGRRGPLVTAYLATHPCKELRHRFLFRNLGFVPLDIDGVVAPGAARVVSFDPHVAPGQQGEVVVVVDVARLRRRKSSHDFLLRSGQSASLTLRLDLEIFPAFDVRPRELSFVVDPATGIGSTEVVIRGADGIEQLSVVWNGNGVEQPARLERIRDAGPIAGVFRVIVPTLKATEGSVVFSLDPGTLRLPGRVR